MQNLIDMDREDELSGRMEHIHHRLHTAYCQFPDPEDIQLEEIRTVGNDEDGGGCSSGGSNGKGSPGEFNSKGCPDGSNGKETPQEQQQPRRDLSHPTLKGLPVSRLQNAVRCVTFLIRLQKRGLS